MASRAILAIDEGTTNSKAVLVSGSGKILSSGARSVETRYPKSGWVEQDADRIWSSTIAAIAACLKSAPACEVSAVGISNQRESVLAWSRTTGKPLGPVITCFHPDAVDSYCSYFRKTLECWTNNDSST